MVILKMRSVAETKDMLHKVKKMYKFAKELKECLEEKVEDSDYDDEDYEEPSYREQYSGASSESDSQSRGYRGGRYGYRRM